MSPENFRFIVLHTIRHKESGIIIQGYGNLEGRGAFFLKASGNKRHTLSVLHPLSILDIETSSRNFGELKSIKEFNTAYNLKSIRSNIGKSAIAIFLSELTLRTIKEFEQNKRLFSFLEHSILDLESICKGSSNFHLYFLVKFTGILGYLPEIPVHTKGMLFDIPSAGYTLGNNMPNLHFDKEESELLATLYRISPENLEDLKIKKELKNQFIKSMLRYISYHTGSEIHCESLGVLQEVFAN
ncbi:MAG: DNA repair protein RecO [Bacteroidales bacterium]